MADPVAEFFEVLGRRQHENLVQNVSGTIRFDVSRGRRVDHWFLTFNKGAVEVEHRTGEADCVVIGDVALFEGIVDGRVNAFAAMLRGALWVTGEPELLVHAQRLFPGPPEPRGGTGRQAPPARPSTAARPGPAPRQRRPATANSARDRRRRKPVSPSR
jgi:SCP-2 sterol transfer family